MSIFYRDETIHRLITHNGTFHSDDVFSTALLLQMNVRDKYRGFDTVEEYVKYYYGSNGMVKPEQVILLPNYNIGIERVSSEQAAAIIKDAEENPEHKDFIMYDVGNGKFDHHKAPREKRENGVPYSAFGKLWRAFGGYMQITGVVEQFQIEAFDRDFVQPICLNDNEGIPNVLSLTIKYMNVKPTDDAIQRGAFISALNYATTTLNIWIRNMGNEAKAGRQSIIDKFSEVIENPDGNPIMLVYDHDPNPYYTSKFYPDVKAVIYPHSRGGWAIESLSDTEIGKSINNRWRAPKEFWGKTDPNDELLMMVGAKFCHATGFIMSFIEKEDALVFARKVCGPDAILCTVPVGPHKILWE